MDGEAGLDRVEVNGALTAGDAFTLAANGARAKFDRTNLVPSILTIGSSEALDVRGGAGGDTLIGAEGNETFLGGSGDDAITGGGGRDVADGQDGNHRLLLRDGTEDLGRGGPGTDAAVADQAGVDALADVETIDRTPGLPPVVGDLKAPRRASSPPGRRSGSRAPAPRPACGCPARPPRPAAAAAR